MILKNAKVLDDSFTFKKLDVKIENGIIDEVAPEIRYGNDDMVIDCDGFMILPGFIDVHIHGCAGFDTSDATREALEGMAKFLITKGVTTFCPTTMTMETEKIEAAMKAIGEAVENPVEGARIAGVNVEGPFLSPGKKGAHRVDKIIAPDFELFQKWNRLCGNRISLIDVAPEVVGGEEFIKKARDICTVSLAHSEAGYDKVKEAFSWGARHVTHLYNAMTGFMHREPGLVGAAFDTQGIFAEIICDGHHIHPSVVKTTFDIMGDRLVIISDSMRANGLPEGEASDLGGQEVTIKDGVAVLANGTIAGSVTNLHQEVKNLVSYGVPLETAVKAASINPARAIGIDSETGSIAKGKRADLLVLDKELNIAAVYHW